MRWGFFGFSGRGGTQDIGGQTGLRGNPEGRFDWLRSLIERLRELRDAIREGRAELTPPPDAAPETEEPAEDQPPAEDPVAEDPVDETPLEDEEDPEEEEEEDPIVEDPIDDDPIVEDPIDDDPLIENPVDDDPIVDDPMENDPVEDDPVEDEPEEDPTDEEPDEEDPVEDDPIQDDPILDDPVDDDPVEEPVEEDPVEEPVEEDPVEEEPPVDEDPIEEDPIEEPPVEEDPIEEDPVEEPPVAEDPVEDDPVEEPPVEEDPVEDDPVEEPPVAEDPVEDEPIEEPPVEEDPVEEEPPVEEDPIEEPPVVEDPIEEPPVDEDPIEEPPVEEEPGEEPPVAEDPPESSTPELPDEAYALNWEGLTAEEQLIVELINRARFDPDAEADRLNDDLAAASNDGSVQALAVVPTLSEAADNHSEDMDARNYFAHTNPDGDSPADRAVEVGHDNRFVGENIGWVGSTGGVGNAQGRAEGHHENLWASDGHQTNLLSDNWSEIGVGYDYGDYVYQGVNYTGSTFVTQNFGDTGKTYLTGVVIDDEDGDEFYDIGEGQGDVRVTAWNDDGVHGTATWDSGGYTLELGPGTYTVSFEGGDLDGVYETTVVIGDENVKLDVLEDRDAVALTSSAEPDAATEGLVSPYLPTEDDRIADAVDYLLTGGEVKDDTLEAMAEYDDLFDDEEVMA